MNNDNFLAFIEDDIATKNVLLSSMPVKTKADIKKYNDQIDHMHEKYLAYKRGVKAYIETKSKSFDIKPVPKDIKLTERVSALESVRFLLNPNNTYVEKMGFDNLLYELSNYYEFNFKSLNKIINQFIDKFELAGITLSGDDFDYTVYVKEYMSAFIETRNTKNGSYEKVSKIFEKIYWVNSDIIEHVELNLRKLIRKNKHHFEKYVKELQSKVMAENNITNYKDCLTKLKSLYIELELQAKENISDIIALAKSGEINITNYFEESKFRTSTYTNLMIEELDFKNEDVMAKFYNNLTKLKANVDEYMNYIRFMPLIKNFRTEYEKVVVNLKESNKKVKTIEGKIVSLENKLGHINKQLSEDQSSITKLLSLVGPKPTQSDAFKLVKELAELYNNYDKEYFNSKVALILKPTVTIPEVLELYYSFDFFKKQAIKKVFNINSYDEIVKYSENFDLFVMNLNNVIIHGIFVFEDSDIDQIIINKYRFDNINLTNEDLSSEELSVLLEKIKFLLRINEIDQSPINVEKIWFITQVEKIKKAEEVA